MPVNEADRAVLTEINEERLAAIDRAKIVLPHSPEVAWNVGDTALGWLAEELVQAILSDPAHPKSQLR